MLTKEEFENLISSIKDRLDETSQALLSEDFLAVLSNYGIAVDEVANLGNEMTKLKTDNEELLKVNGRLFQKIGFEKEDKKEEMSDDNKEDEIVIEDIIDERGDFKNE